VLTPSEPRSRFLIDFIGLRDSLREQRIGRGGHEVSAMLTGELDKAIAALVAPLPERVAIVALGGYGRGEMSPYSDVDLMLLHELEDPSDLAAELFRPLWDAKLRVGHSVRTVKESGAAARERFDTQTTLLTSRLLAGDHDLFDSLTDAVTAVTRARPLRRHLVAEERRRREQTPFIRMAVDVKTGRGGLRTLHAFEWERRREALIGRFSAESGPEEDAARESLVRIRNAIHVSTGRRHDEFSVDLREPVARWLGVDVFDAAEELVGALQAVDSLAAGRWPEILEREERVGRRAWLRISGRADPLALDRPPGLAEMSWMLEAGEKGRVSFDRLRVSGHIDELLPEWEVVRGRPQLAPFHEHPVDAHLWRTVAEMQRLISGEGEYSRVGEELGDGELLLMAAFLHDIGKGQGRPHAETGAEIAHRFCDRLGMAAHRAGDIEHAVLHHLVLAETATRRDLDDPAVIDEITEIVGSARRLQILYLLTVADSMATGPSMWSEWKAQLLRTLFLRVRRLMDDATPGEGFFGTTPEQVLAAAGGERVELVRQHLATMPEGYVSSTHIEDVMWHVEAIRSHRGSPIVDVRQGTPVETAVVIGESSPLFRSQVAESFAANGIDVLEAKLHTRSDGLVVDIFHVRHDRTGGEVGEDRWDQARRDIEAAVRGQLDTVSKLEARAAAYESQSPTARKPIVACSIDSATGDVVVVVKCSDRIGRLAEILGAIGGCGLEVRLAKLDTRGDEVVDTFHVRADEVVDAESVSGLSRLIAAGITP
jgi:[protein-PII] uridylyltransferase